MSDDVPRITLRTLRKWVRDGRPIPFLTCYDATTASWLWQGGLHCMLVGDTAAQVILGHDSTLPAKMPFMLEITRAVRRGAPRAFIMADMPFGSYHCGDDEAMRNAIAFMVEGQADAVKLEVDLSHAELVSRMSKAGVPVVAHLGSRPQQVRAQGGYRSMGRTPDEAAQAVMAARHMLGAGAAMLLLEAVPAEVSEEVVKAAMDVRPDPAVVIGCGGGPACHGHVVVLQDVMGLTPWQPPFAKPMADLGSQFTQVARQWVELVESGNYLKADHPYRMQAKRDG